MKKTLLVWFTLAGLMAAAQKETHPASFKPGVLLSTVPQQSVSGTDTTVQDLLSISPLAGVYANGFGFEYAYSIAPGLTSSSAYMQSIRASYEKFDKGWFDVYTTYSHLFFNPSSSVLATPLKNILTGYADYKGLWLKPLASFSYGFGNDETGKNKNQVNVSGGVLHGFNWTNDKVSFEFDPALTVNAGTTEFYNAALGSLKVGQAIAPSSNGHGHKHSGSSGGSAGKTSPAQFTLNNVELGTYSDLAIGQFHVLPMASLFFPLNSNLSANVSSFWQLELNYEFNIHHRAPLKHS